MISGIRKLSHAEMEACKKALGRDDFPSGLSYTEKAPEVVVEVMAAFYHARFGPAPGSVAVRPDGGTAVRYYDVRSSAYRWRITPSPELTGISTATTEDVEKLPAKDAWTVHEARWHDLVWMTEKGTA